MIEELLGAILADTLGVKTMQDLFNAADARVGAGGGLPPTAAGPLRLRLKSASGSMKDLTVLAAQNDPFRVDTPAGHRDGKWLADQIAALELTGPRHLRGLHYVLIDRAKPNGVPYTNTDGDWQWLAGVAKCARWLGYVPFDRIVDQRNDEPVVKEFTPADPEPHIWLDFEVTIPEADQLRPLAGMSGFIAEQPYHLVLVGEKSSLRPVLGDVAERYQADLYLPTGEISDTQAYRMARSSVVDGRPLVIFYFSDSDPAGWQMPISLTRKLQALKVVEFGDLKFEMRRVALTPDQVKQYGLPSTPLKDTEKRADRWKESMGVEQTEIDALAALRPDLLRELADEALAPFFDRTLAQRVRLARQEWIAEAQEELDRHSEDNGLEAMRAEAAERLAEKRDEIKQILDTVHVDPEALEVVLPEPHVPLAETHPELAGEPLCDSRWAFVEQCRRLKSSKSYTGDPLGGVA